MGSRVNEKHASVHHVHEKEGTSVPEMEGGFVSRDKMQSRASCEGPFEMSAESGSLCRDGQRDSLNDKNGGGKDTNLI
jgi:hypothetical protein